MLETRILLFGAGDRCSFLLKNMEKSTGISIVAVIDSNQDKVGKYIHRYIIRGKEELYNFCDENWCITIGDNEENEKVKEELIGCYGFNREKKFTYDQVIYQVCLRSVEYRTIIMNNENIFFGSDKVCLFGLINGLVLGGIETRVKLLCKALIENNFENVYIVTNDESPDFDVDASLISHIIKTKIDGRDKFITIKNLIETISRNLPCTVITNQPDDLLIAALVVKSICSDQIKIISIISGSEDSIYKRYREFPIQSDLYIGVSIDIKKRLISEGINPDKVMSMQVPFPCRSRLDRYYQIDGQKPIRLGYAGRLEYVQKRIDLLIKLLLRLDEDGIAYDMKIAGEGTALEYMKNVFKENRVNRVRFLGKLKKEKMIDFWKSNDICLNLADFEGRSISVVEAMGAGAVPIVTNTSGVNEDITDGINGFIVPVGDYESAVDRIKYLDENRDQLSEMGMKAHNEVLPKSSMEKHVEFWKSVL